MDFLGINKAWLYGEGEEKYDPTLIPNADAIISAVVTDPKTGHGMVTFSHCIRKIPGGIEYRSHYWQGMGFDENEKETIP